MMELRKYQQESLDAINKRLSEGINKQILVLPTGSGKTIVFSHLIKERQKLGKTLILAHREELLTQAQDKLTQVDSTITSAIEQAEKKANGEEVVIASVATIGRKGSKRLLRLDPKQFKTIIVDECFVAGTPIDNRPIETIRVGDFALSYDENKKKITPKIITHIFKRKPNNLINLHLSNNQNIVCTPNHPFFIRNKWVPAGSLLKDDVLTTITDFVNINIHDLSKTNLLPELSKNSNSPDQTSKRHGKERKSVLFRYLQKIFSPQNIISNNEQNKSEIRLRKNEDKQSNVQSYNCGENATKTNWTNIFSKGWQWVYDCTTTKALEITQPSRRMPRISNTDKTSLGTISFLTKLLQGRHWNTSKQISNRNRWQNSQAQKVEIFRPPQNRNTQRVRVDSITFHKRGSQQFRKLCPDGFVYNLEVEDNHTYFANEVLVHNCHHSSAQSYQTVLEHFGILKDKNEWNKDLLLLGVTATPSRNDNFGIDKIFSEVVYNYGIVDAIRDGWLCRIRAFRVDTKASLDQVHTTMGDFAQDELADVIDNADRNSLVVKTYLENFSGKQALVFAINVAHAEALTKAFDDKGIITACISGKTNKDQRKQDLQDFHDKKINVVINCMVLTEGYDNSAIDAIFMARPTKSGILYSQMVGRGTRIHPDKPYLTVVDFVDNTYRHTLKTSASLLGLDNTINFRGKDIVDSLEQIEKIQELAPNYNLNKLDFDKLDYIMEEVDLLGGLEIPKLIAPYTTYSWQKLGSEYYRINIGNGQSFVVEQTMTGQYTATFKEWDNTTHKETSEVLGETDDLETVIKKVDKYIRNNHEDSLKLIRMSANWREDYATDKQKDYLRKLGVDWDVISKLNKGQASMLTTKLLGQKRKYV